jgi:hypothetical protein
VLWCFFLWRVSRLELRLVPTHPDGAGGLGLLEVVHTEFTPLVLAISAAQSAALAQDIASGRMKFDAIYSGVAFLLLVDAVLFLGPLFLFLRKLWACKVEGLSDYSALAERYVNEFDRKWLDAGPAAGEPLLGTADIQSLADLSTSVGIVRDCGHGKAGCCSLVMPRPTHWGFACRSRMRTLPSASGCWPSLRHFPSR